MNGKCPFCKREYEYYCHEGCPQTKKIIDKLQEIKDFGASSVSDLTYDELDFIIDALMIRYRGED